MNSKYNTDIVNLGLIGYARPYLYNNLYGSQEFREILFRDILQQNLSFHPTMMNIPLTVHIPIKKTSAKSLSDNEIIQRYKDVMIGIIGSWLNQCKNGVVSYLRNVLIYYDIDPEELYNSIMNNIDRLFFINVIRQRSNATVVVSL